MALGLSDLCLQGICEVRALSALFPPPYIRGRKARDQMVCLGRGFGHFACLVEVGVVPNHTVTWMGELSVGAGV